MWSTNMAFTSGQYLNSPSTRVTNNKCRTRIKCLLPMLDAMSETHLWTNPYRKWSVPRSKIFRHTTIETILFALAHIQSHFSWWSTKVLFSVKFVCNINYKQINIYFWSEIIISCRVKYIHSLVSIVHCAALCFNVLILSQLWQQGMYSTCFH